MKLGTLFHGFGGFDLGAHAAGLTPAWGIKYDDDLASVARDNGLPCMTTDVLTVDFDSLVPVGWLHASPPCPNFSVAKANRGETEADLALADAVCRAIDAQRPLVFSLENVRAYMGSESLRRIHAQLADLGYDVTSDVLCAADYGVPQTRDRLILVAAREQRAKLPVPTHAKEPKPSDMFGFAALPWNGWYAAVEDLLPSLPDSKLAPWQEKRLPEEMRTMLVGQGGYDGRVATAEQDDPALTVTANGNQTAVKAMLVSSHSVEGGAPSLRSGGNPSVTVDTKTGQVRAVLVGDQHRQYRGGQDPANTVRAGGNGGAEPRAILIDGKLNNVKKNGDDPQSLSTRTPDSPALVVTTSHNNRDMKALVLSPRVRVVQLTPRCLARFQSFPDHYRLPGKNTLACKGIGNAVAVGMATAIVAANT